MPRRKSWRFVKRYFAGVAGSGGASTSLPINESSGVASSSMQTYVPSVCMTKVPLLSSPQTAPSTEDVDTESSESTFNEKRRRATTNRIFFMVFTPR